MLYQEYRQKNQKRLGFLEKLWKVRFFILGGLVLLLALIGTLLGITGIVVGEEFPMSVTYGEALNFEAKAVFRDARVEYRAVGGEWSSEEPRLVGEYEARGVSESVTGGDRFGEAIRFTIVPRPVDVTVSSDDIVYGDAPSASAELAYGDRLSAVSFKYEWQTSVRCLISVSSALILNEEGADVTNCYALNFPRDSIGITPRPITVRTAAAEKEYDGTPLTAEGYELVSGTLAYDDRIESADFASLTDVGSVGNRPELLICNGNGENVTAHYDIEWELGSLSVTPRAVSFLSRSESGTYGDIRPSAPALLSGSLVQGHSLVLTEEASAFGAGTYSYEELFCVVDGEGRDVTGNYELDFGGTAFTIEPRPITVWTASRTWIYDGRPHVTSEEGDYGIAASSPYPLLGGHTLSPDPESGQLTEITDTETEVVTVENPLILRVLTAEGEDVTDNYTIAYEKGELRIKTEVIVTFYASSRYYDGTPLSVGEDDYSVVKPPDTYVEVHADVLPSIEGTGSLCVEDIASLNAGTRRIVTILDFSTGADAYADNRLRFETAGDVPVLEVLPRPITIKTPSVSVYPTGEPFIGSELALPSWISLGTLVAGHTLEVEVTGVLDPLEERAENTVGGYRITDRYGNDVTHCYEVTLDEGVLSWLEKA